MTGSHSGRQNGAHGKKFHCTGIVLTPEATANGDLRVSSVSLPLEDSEQSDEIIPDIKT